MKEYPETMKTHRWELIGPSRYTTHFRCAKCGAEGIYGKRVEIPVEKDEHGSAVMGELPTPEFYDNNRHQKLTCNEIIVKNVLT